MSDEFNERDSQGNLTDWALACDALSNHGCDCGEDEPGTCLPCLCEKAMRSERDRAECAETDRDFARHQRDASESALSTLREAVTRLLNGFVDVPPGE